MPVDLAGALVGWVVSVVGDAGIRLARRSPDERALSKAMGLAIDRVVEQADSSSQEALRLGLRECFSAQPRLGLDASTSVGEGLRAAIVAQVAQLDQMMHSDTGQPFYQAVPVERVWLVEQVTAAVLTALRQVVAAGGLAELVHGVDAAELLARLEELTVSAPVAATRTLPRDIGSFTGRQNELWQLISTVTGRAATGGVVGIHAIDGMAGVGKTAFAVHAAHQLAPHFPDGQIFLRLHAHTPGQQPADPAEALATLLLTLGIAPQQIPAGLEARELLWRDHLSDKKVLLVLDDAAGLQQVDPLLPGTADSLVLITSRRRLAALDDAISISLDILAPEEAAALFIRVAARYDLQPIDTAVAEVTRLCGYLPLAIRLVAGRLRHPTWTVADVAAGLAAARDRLAAMDDGERSVAAAFDLSYRDLTTAQQQLFRRLGLQPGADIDAYAAAALDDTAVPAARHHLEGLYDLHLIEEPVRGRYRFHDLLGDYARSLAATDPPIERDAALNRLLDYYLHTTIVAASHLTVRTRATDPPVIHQPSSIPELATRNAGIAWLEAERANLHAATAYAALHGWDLHAIHLSTAMHDFLRTQGPWNQALTLHQTALGVAHKAGDRLGEANALRDLGVVQYLTDDYPAAAVNLEQALVLYRDLGDRLGEANALKDLGFVQRLSGDYPAAAVSLEQALVLYRDLGDRLGEAEVLNNLGQLLFASSAPADGCAHYVQALDIARALGTLLEEARALEGIGKCRLQEGQVSEGAECLRQALVLYRRLGSPGAGRVETLLANQGLHGHEG